ncbi:PLP-dependent aminotransferase family protein [Shewanella salipaludis]|uniref:PLP-dependent aminotransferase family protein n=1 Tax=Shewanella salipaludis TaxID=2723052 RepID=A0A972FQ39_9GAMM|nr:PLP-dependent aminotransferase family protein [Shewanella salipaludis]NMH63687.1 PLP-dependent aminotransferase family protein [Shewanella salipaludis]
MGTMWTPSLAEFSGPKYQRLLSALAQAIQAGQLPPGTKLPPQRRLADALQLTVGTVTRAYTLAEQRGYVEARVGDGTYVAAIETPAHEPAQVNLATCQQPLTDQVAQLSDCLQALAKSPAKLAALLGYHANPLPHQQAIFHRWLSRRGILQSPQQLVFTHGAQQGIFAILNALCSAGDTLLHEAYCYPGVRVAAAQLGLNTSGIPLAREGLDLAAFERLLRAHRPKLVYLTLNNQNPTCIQYSQPQRRRLLALASEYDFYIIEDDVNYCLPEEWQPPLWNQTAAAQPTLRPETRPEGQPESRVIYIASLSKLFAGGLRQGFMLLPDALMPQIKRALHSQCWMVSPLNVELACQLLERGELQSGRDQLIRRRQQAFRAMGERLRLQQNWRGLNGWLQLPAPVKAHHIVTALAAKGILVRNGDDFNNHDNHIRLSIGGIGSEAQFTHTLETIATTISAVSQSAYSVV